MPNPAQLYLLQWGKGAQGEVSARGTVHSLYLEEGEVQGRLGWASVRGCLKGASLQLEMKPTLFLR